MTIHSLHSWYQQKKISLKKSYLKNGTGNPCVLHNISNPWPSFRKIILFLSSGSTVGALAPTGSKIKIFY